VRSLLTRRKLDLPNRIDAAGKLGREAMAPRPNTNLQRAIGVVRILNRLTTSRAALVFDDGARGLRLQHQLRHARLERREVALKLRALVSVDALAALGQVLLDRVDGLAVALELHGAEPKVAQNLPRGRRGVRRLELAVRLFIASAIRILQQVHARREMRACFVADHDLRRPRRQSQANHHQPNTYRYDFTCH
jgi:hypothetical protein